MPQFLLPPASLRSDPAVPAKCAVTVSLGEDLRYPYRMDRRDFLMGIPLVLGSGKSVAGQSPAGSVRSSESGPPLDVGALEFMSALEAAEAIRRKKVSSVELTRLVFERIDRYNPELNAFVYQLREAALAAAAKADDVKSRTSTAGVLRGVPIFVKESFAVAGYPCTWGLVPFRNSKAPQNSAVVDRLLGAGAILVGATNVPVNLFDWQSHNPVYGTTNNPWDVKRTPGGSSGGTAAALAAGLGHLSIGSDIGGSIRVPAHFCGVFGHKPTLDLVDFSGHSPGGTRGVPGFSTLLAAAGPMARSAEDLLAALKVLGGPSGWETKAWKWQMPEPRARSLRDFRVGFVIDDPFAPPTSEVKKALETTVNALAQAGAQLKPGWPDSFSPAELLRNYLFLLEAFAASVSSPEDLERQRKESGSLSTQRSEGKSPSFVAWQQQNFRRLAFRAQWQAYFESVDVFLSPVSFSTAFPHDHSLPMDARVIHTAEGPRRYLDNFNWISIATVTGCPATVAPVGLTATGLPVGIQIMGPYWEDATPLTFACLLEKEIVGFRPPPGYSGLGAA
jgi:amidase